VIESGSHSPEYGKEISYPIMGHRIDNVPFAEDPRGEQRGKSQNTPEDLVNALEPKTSGLRNKLGLDGWNMHVPWKPDRARDDKRKDKRVEREPGQLRPLQIDLGHRIPELSDTGIVIQEPQSAGVPNALAAELEGDNAMPNYGRDLPGEDGVRQTVPWDVNSNSSTRAEANLALTDDIPNVPELPSNPAYRRPLPAPLELGGTSASSFVKQSSSDPSVELRRIQDEVVQAMMDYPELKGPGPKFETTTGSINRILREYGRMKNTNNRTKREYSEHFVKAQDDLRAANTGLQGKLNARERELKGLKSKHEQELERLEREISSLKFQKRELESSHGNKLRKEKRSLQNEIDNLQSKLRKTQNDADSDRRDLEKRLGKAFKINDDLKAQLVKEANMWQQHSNRLVEAKADLERRLQSAKSDEQERVDAIHAEWQDKLHQERREHDDSLRRLRSDIEQLKGDLRRERSGHQEELRKQEEVLMNRYEARIKENETVIEDFKSSSARREHFKGMTDSQVAAEYKRLASSIDEFSRVEWDRNKEHTWPISDDHMRKLAKNTRKLRQQIIQNTLWLLLYDHVFRSPFKILGTDGEQDDAEWIPIYSSGNQHV
jgi:predicted  nucleic acid-binding Zn-ribbon protein